MTITEQTRRLVSRNRLRDAFALLRKEASGNGNFTIADRLDALEQTYRYMIHYMMEGTADDGRRDLHDNMKDELLELADRLYIDQVMKTDPSPYFAEMRMQQYSPSDLDTLLTVYFEARVQTSFAEMAGNYDKDNNIAAEESLRNIFNTVWVTPFLTKGMAETLKDALVNPQSPSELKSQIVSALLLGSIQFYDSRKVKLLLTAYAPDSNSADMAVAARIITALLLILSRYHDRAVLDKEIRNGLDGLLLSDNAIYRLRTVVLNLVRAFDTDRINSKLRDDVIPGIMKLQPKIMKRLRESGKDPAAASPEMNPEWQDILEKNGLGDKLRELQDLQMEGGDVMMMAFSNLKSFPFFSQIPNWFLPFTASHSSLDKFREANNSALDLITGDNSGICNSDKFSFAFSIDRMPEAQRNIMFGSLDAQLDQLKEEMAADITGHQDPTFDNAATRYVRDIYRFFRLHPKRDSFTDPFAHPFDFTCIPVLGQALSDYDTLKLIAEFYFKYGYYAEAVALFRKIIDSADQPDAHLFEKAGFCYQSMGDNVDALAFYRKAELLEPQSKWLRRKLAFVNRAMGNYDEAAAYYSSLLADDPDNIRMLMNLGNCLTESGQWSDALKNYYKVNYLDPDNTNAWRAIAWCEMQSGNADKSSDFFNRLLLTDPTTTDYLNAGHQALVSGDIKKAASLYKMSIMGHNGDFDAFFKEFREDMAMLENLGVDTTMIPILMDKIKYDL